MTRWPMAVLALLLCMLWLGSGALPAPVDTRLREEGGGGREQEEAAALLVGGPAGKWPSSGHGGREARAGGILPTGPPDAASLGPARGSPAGHRHIGLPGGGGEASRSLHCSFDS